MPTAQITNLPNELISHVFCSMEDFLSATNFSKTSHKFQVVWQHDIEQICHAIHQQSIECTPQVYEYLSISIEAGKTTLHGDKREITIAKTLILTERASNADKALSKFLKFVAVQSLADAVITPTTRRDFIKAYHRAWTLAKRAPQLAPYQMITKMDVLELLQLGEVLNWMLKLSNDSERAELGYSCNIRDIYTLDIFAQHDCSQANFQTWSHVWYIVQAYIQNFMRLIGGTIFQKLSGEQQPKACNALLYDTRHPGDSWYPKDKRLILGDFVHLFPGCS